MNDRQKLSLLIIIMLLIQILDILETQPHPPTKLHQIYSVEKFLSNNAHFFALTRFNLDVFHARVVQPMYSYLLWPKDWLDHVPANATRYPFRKKARRLDPANRMFRALMYLTNSTRVPMLETLFGDKKDTIYTDLVFICTMIVKVLGPDQIKLPQVDTQEYAGKVGSGRYSRLFPHSVYSMDVTHMVIKKPSRGQRSYYCGHHKVHCCKWLAVHNLQDGTVDYISDAFPGHNNDLTILSRSLLGQEPQRFVKPAHNIICDGIFSMVGQPLLTRYTNRAQLTPAQRVFNTLHSKKRILCENYYGRLKQSFPAVFDSFDLDVSKADLFMRACVILQNIICRHQSPLRQ